jgi:hypothetical protein
MILRIPAVPKRCVYKVACVRFRSHIVRPLDPASPWNRAILVIAVVAGAAGALLTVLADRNLSLAVEAGGQTFLSWALVRELDPDRQPSAIIAAIVGGVLALIGVPTALFAFLGLLMTARFLVETTGRRPLPTDLAAMSVLASVISFTPLGWVMGFGLATSLYIDDRMAEEHNRQVLLAAIGGALGSSAVVTLSGALPETVPSVRPLLAALVGLLALVAVAREPADPVSFVDSRSKRFLRRDRLHTGRAVCALLVFAGVLVAGDAAGAVIPMAMALAIALASSEVERLRLWRAR